ncbi:hypothetical protein FRUB_05649 [Fimbriiglobus ruber]|uniref:Uncharacterized protein n=1 Tax=Fimbriiglobus ruber TaxID=1908690 RepID=A0A225DRJ0_9BACT|nr:hypothetical protein FRUB_05649 [Fimbriiglobus ruber]
MMGSISVSVAEVNGQRYAILTPSTAVRKPLPELWGLPANLYEKTAAGFPEPPPNASEP